ncbi:MAG TPA: hypothetical protein DD727_00615 [Clostridiales bacterium]|nr:hypothetical protein [Clostridiales bacterium]
MPGKWRLIRRWLTLVVCLLLTAGCSAFYKGEEQSVTKTLAAVTSDPAAAAASSPAPLTIRQGKAIPILYYHGISDTTYGLEEMFVRPAEFEEQMKYLHDHGYTPITFDDFEMKAARLEKPVVITFDDGYRDNLINAYPILSRYGFPAVIFLCTDFIGGGSILTVQDIKQMTGLISFQSHTLDHGSLTALSPEEAERQLKQSQSILRELTGQPVNAIAYPTGYYNSITLEITARYYKYGVLAGGGVFYFDPAKQLEMVRVYIPRGLNLSGFEQKLLGLTL